MQDKFRHTPRPATPALMPESATGAKDARNRASQRDLQRVRNAESRMRAKTTLAREKSAH